MSQPPSIDATIRKNLQYYLENAGASPTGVYAMVLAAVEAPLLHELLQHCAGNQSQMAEILGINRNTLRKKLLSYQLIESESV